MFSGAPVRTTTCEADKMVEKTLLVGEAGRALAVSASASLPNCGSITRKKLQPSQQDPQAQKPLAKGRLLEVLKNQVWASDPVCERTEAPVLGIPTARLAPHKSPLPWPPFV